MDERSALESLKRMESSIPFSGFYESVHSQKLDEAAAYLTQDDNGDQIEFTEGEGDDAKTVNAGEELYWHIQWSAAQLAYAQLYVEAFAAWVKHECNLDLQLEWQEMISPQYYNFETDRLFVTTPREVVHEMFRRTSVSLLDKTIREKFTSYDGFSSYYSNSLDAWLGGDAEEHHHRGNTSTLDEWDGNQVGTLLEAFLSQYTSHDDYREFEYEAVNDDNGAINNIMYDALDAEGRAIVKRIDDDRERKETITRDQGRLFG